MLLETIDYEQLCVDADLADLADLTHLAENAIARLAPALTLHPAPPLDLAGVLNPLPAPRPPAPPHSASHDRVILGEPPVPRGLTGQANDPRTWWTSPFQAPPLYAASLHDVLCFGGLPAGEHRSGHLLLVGDRFLVPDSYFVRNTVRSLPSDLLAPDGAPAHGTPGKFRLRVDVADVPTLPGIHYFAGAAFGHFGHFILEGLSRWWLLALLPASLRAQLRFVLYDDRPLPPWQLELLQCLGVAPDRLLHLTQPMRFERLLVPSTAYHLHRGIASAHGDTWERIAAAFDRGRGGPERVYLSRSHHRSNRVLLNEPDVERHFQARGFTVLHPQELSIAQQLAAVRHAKLIAGSAGSAMYLSAFARPGARKLIVSPRNFTFRDDQLISHLRDQQLAYLLCPNDPSARHPRYSDYRVAPDLLTAALDRWIADCA
jgi:capsular polysaccharide biosynthesis protein